MRLTVQFFNTIKMSNPTTETLTSIFLKSVSSVNPKHLLRKSVEVQANKLIVCKDIYNLTRPCYLVGMGKAAFDMAREIEEILGDNLREGVVNVPFGAMKCDKSSRIRFVEGAHNNLPDENAERGARLIKGLIEKLEVDDLLLVLISGGGSALLPLPKHPLTLMEKLNITESLAKRGANICELNSVRKRLSVLKGGGLAKLAYPTPVVSLIISDIIDDPISSIASGPTTPNLDESHVAIEVLKKYSLYDELPVHAVRILQETDTCNPTETFPHVRNYIIGNNQIAANAALSHATALGYQSFVLSTRVQGEVGRISEIYAELARQVASLIISNKGECENFKLFLETFKSELGISEFAFNEITNFNFKSCSGICLIFGGEPTVTVKGKGKGGRNQQLALSFSIEINKLNVDSANISFLSCGTDGIDGPTDAAGAFGTSNLVSDAFVQNINPTQFLADNDSYGFYTRYRHGKYLVRTGHTGTNVMDIHILIVSPKAE
uniref:Glycerate kinase n=1 Tax=Photinus pyralis TaxID=7054 RepID=A0A1Y1KYP8_PHOPY